jgi:hypothetical protein
MSVTQTGFWTASEHQKPPQDGKPFWAWLHQTGIRRMVWVADFYEDGGTYVLTDDRGDDYEPDFWAPLSAIPDPADEFAHLREDDPA